MSALQTAPAPEEAPGTTLALVPPAPAKKTASTRDYIHGIYWGAGSGLAALIAGSFYARAETLPLLMAAGAVLGFLAWLDHKTHRVLDAHNAGFGIITLILLAATQGAFGIPVIIPGLIGAATAFVFLIVLSYCRLGIGGGDLKLSPMAGAAMGVFAGIAGPLVWVALTVILHSVWMLACTAAGKKTGPVAGVPFMAAAFTATIILLGAAGAGSLYI